MDTNADTAGIEIQGWTVGRDGVSWTATRDTPLTAWQERYGCRTQVTARTDQEMRLLVLAEDVQAGMVSAAEGFLIAMADIRASAPAPVARLPRRGPMDMPPSRDEWRHK